jgi:hypothetical protein
MTPKGQRMQRLLRRRLRLRVYRFNNRDRCIACGRLVRLHFWHGRKLDCHQVREIR